MQMNYSVWDYYAPNHVDPLFKPYQKKKYTAQPGHPRSDTEGCEYNPYKPLPGPDIHPEHVRVGWGTSYQRLHATSPCGHGFVKAPFPNDHWCIPEEREFEPVFYTSKAHLPVNQYQPPRQFPHQRKSNNFDMRSVHPATGTFTQYYKSKPRQRSSNKSPMPTRHSYVGGGY